MDAPQWRRNFAEQLIKLHIDNEQVKLGFICGSVSTDSCDEYSDIEIGFVWSSFPDQPLETLFPKSQGFSLVLSSEQQVPENTIEITYFYKELQIDVFHILHDDLERFIQNMSQSVAIDFNSLSFIQQLQHLLPYKDQKLIKDWRNRIDGFSDDWQERVIEKFIGTFFKADVNLFACRNDLTMFYNLVSAYQKNIYQILLALNGEYFSSYKHIKQRIKTLKIKPEGIEAFYEILKDNDLKTIWQQTIAMKHEVYDLVTQHKPGALKTLDLDKWKGFGREGIERAVIL